MVGSHSGLAILVGACECAVAGTCTLVIGWTLFPWYLLISVLGALLSVPILIRRHRRRAVTERSTRRTSQISWIVTMTALVLTLGACLVPLRVPSVGWDARAIWLLRSSWFLQGHDYLLFAMRDSNPSGLIAHASYPPLVSTAAAISWQVTGTHSERLGVMIVALLNATATLATAWVIVEVGRIAGQQQGQGKESPPGGIDRRGVRGALRAGGLRRVRALCHERICGPLVVDGRGRSYWLRTDTSLHQAEYRGRGDPRCCERSHEDGGNCNCDDPRDPHCRSLRTGRRAALDCTRHLTSLHDSASGPQDARSRR